MLNRKYIAVMHDLLMAAISIHIALYMRLGDNYVLFAKGYLLPSTAVFATLVVTIAMLMRLHQRFWRYASMQDLMVITKVVTISVVVFYLTLFLFTRLHNVPRSVPFIHWMILMGMLGGPRLLYRMFKERSIAVDISQQRKVPVLLIGAGDDAELFLREMQRNPDSPYRVVGIVDDRKESHGRNLHGVRIWGDSSGIKQVVDKLAAKDEAPQRLIITDRHIDGAQMRYLLELSEQIGIPLGRLPRLSEISNGLSEALEIKPIAVEDLLGRAQNTYDKSSMKELVAGKVVMVTGAGGSIGSELCRQISSFEPRILVLFEMSEYNLYQLEQELEASYPHQQRHYILSDVRDEESLNHIIRTHKPEIVFHAAAIKHVPIAEANPEETVLTNIFGTKYLADACITHGVAAMVMISTDKAVNPTNVMGATKRAAESYTQALGQEYNDGATKFITVRFGNVLGSTGSVVPLFQKQLAAGGPITITHPEMVRYFMTIREAVELVIYAATMGVSQAESNGTIFVLDMGQPVRISDLAMQMIKLAGLRPDIDIKIEYTGLRPGEKLFEELFHFSENVVKTAHDSIMRSAPRSVKLAMLKQLFVQLHAAAQQRQKDDVLKQLKQIVPEFSSPKHEEIT